MFGWNRIIFLILLSLGNENNFQIHVIKKIIDFYFMLAQDLKTEYMKVFIWLKLIIVEYSSNLFFEID